MRGIFLTVSVFMFTTLGLASSSYATSLSELDIVVKETVISSQPFHPTLNIPLDFYHIGALDFTYNHRPLQCASMISGLILEHNQYTSDPVMSFVVCIVEDQARLLTGHIVELRNF